MTTLESISGLYIKQYKKWYVLLGTACSVLLVALLINQISALQTVELKSLDYRFVHFPLSAQADSNIVLVAIDKNSLDYFSKNGISYPWPRDFYAHALHYLTAVGARTVQFDMLFYEPDLRRAETDPEETDGAFAEAIRHAGNVTLGAELQKEPSEKNHELQRFGVDLNNNQSRRSAGYTDIELPIDTLLNAAKAIGLTNIEPDQDGIYRRVKLLRHLGAEWYPNLALSAYLTSTGETGLKQSGNNLRLQAMRVPLQDDGNYLINWYGAGGPNGVFRYVPFSALIQSASARLTNQTPVLPDHTFRGKDVFIGASAPGLLDLKPTPFTEYSVYPGMEIWATVLSNLHQGNFVHFLPWGVNLLNTLLVSFLVMVFFTRYEMRYSNPLNILILIYIFAVAFIAWISSRTAMNLTLPVTGFFLSYVYIASVSYMVEGRSRREIRKVFSRYVHPDVIQNLMKEPNLVRMGGDEIYATVLFTDIYNFTGFSEGKSAPELVQYLNEYFDKLTSFVLDHNGLLDKYTGDGIMALFGAPLPRDDHAQLACQAALAHRDFGRQLLAEARDLSPSEQFHLNTRTGINSGPIVAGNIGSERRTDYTAIGDDVNLAARLEGVNKIFRTQIIVSESTYKLVREGFIFRELDMLRVKGKKEPVKIYELVDTIDKRSQGDYEWISLYEEALEVYRAGQWRQATKLFAALTENGYDDTAAQAMIERCKVLKKARIKDWDGIYTLMSK